VPRDAETCGPVVHDDERHVFVSVQHPGEEGSFEAQNSLFPDAMRTAPLAGSGGGSFEVPRPSVVQVMPLSRGPLPEQEDPLAPTGGGMVGALLAGAGTLVAGGLAVLARRKRENGGGEGTTPSDEV
jgi:LPXTG-motif cell wall-anchored protein